MDVRCPACGDPEATELNTGRDWYLACCRCEFTAGPVPLPPDEVTHLSDLLLSPIPEGQISALFDRIGSARELAHGGYLALGFDELVHGLREATDRLGHTPWAGELVARYRLALDRYCLTFGVPMPGSHLAANGPTSG